MSNDEFFGKCIFKTEDIVQLVNHVKGCTEFRTAYGQGEPEAGLMWVHDQGVYLCSSGLPLLQNPNKDHTSSIVAYAEGMNPEVDDFELWWEESRYNVGADDFAEFISLKEFPDDVLEAYKYFIIDVASDTMRLRYSTTRR